MCDAVGYMKEVGMSEDELIEHVRETYQAYVGDDELDAIATIDNKEKGMMEI